MFLANLKQFISIDYIVTPNGSKSEICKKKKRLKVTQIVQEKHFSSAKRTFLDARKFNNNIPMSVLVCGLNKWRRQSGTRYFYSTFRVNYKSIIMDYVHNNDLNVQMSIVYNNKRNIFFNFILKFAPKIHLL